MAPFHSFVINWWNEGATVAAKRSYFVSFSRRLWIPNKIKKTTYRVSMILSTWAKWDWKLKVTLFYWMISSMIRGLNNWILKFSPKVRNLAVGLYIIIKYHHVQFVLFLEVYYVVHINKKGNLSVWYFNSCCWPFDTDKL